jgi:hypothetical protein
MTVRRAQPLLPLQTPRCNFSERPCVSTHIFVYLLCGERRNDDPAWIAPAQTPTPTPRRLIAAPWHTLSILLIFAYFGFRASLPSSTIAQNPRSRQRRTARYS